MKSNIISMKQTKFLIMSVLIFTFRNGEAQKFNCPVKNGSIIIFVQKNSEQAKPSRIATIEALDSIVYSSSSGVVAKIDTNENSAINVFVKCNEFGFFYSGLRNVTVNKGDSIKASQILGTVSGDNRFQFTIIKDGKPLMASDFIKCTKKTIGN